MLVSTGTSQRGWWLRCGGGAPTPHRNVSAGCCGGAGRRRRRRRALTGRLRPRPRRRQQRATATETVTAMAHGRTGSKDSNGAPWPGGRARGRGGRTEGSRRRRLQTYHPVRRPFVCSRLSEKVGREGIEKMDAL